MKSELSAFFDRVRPAVDATLNELLPPESASPERIHQAMRYTTLDGGKRIRPCLCVAAFAAYKDDWTPATVKQLEAIHRSKPGALIGASVRIGAYLGGAPDSDLERIRTFCDRVGLAFQVIDDILDATDGSNRDEGKATYPGIHGLEKSREIAHDLMKGARSALSPLGERARILLAFCDYLESRTH